MEQIAVVLWQAITTTEAHAAITNRLSMNGHVLQAVLIIYKLQDTTVRLMARTLCNTSIVQRLQLFLQQALRIMLMHNPASLYTLHGKHQPVQVRLPILFMYGTALLGSIMNVIPTNILI